MAIGESEMLSFYDKTAEVALFIYFGLQADWTLFYVNQAGDLVVSNMQFVSCLCPSRDSCAFDEGATFLSSANLTIGYMARVQAETYYKVLFRYLFPGLYFITAAIAALFLSITLLQLKKIYSNDSLMYAIVHHKGGRTSILVILLFLEMISSGTLAFVQFSACLYCSDTTLKEDTISFFAPQLTTCSCGTTLLAGVFWLDRRRALERQANFQKNDERPFFIRQRNLIRAIALSAFFVDGAIGMMLVYSIPYFELIVGALGMVISVSLATFFIIEAIKFYSMIQALKANSGGA